MTSAIAGGGSFDAGAFGVEVLVGVAVVGLVLGTAFFVGRATARHRVVDVAWGGVYAAVALSAFLVSTGRGDDGRRILVLVLAACWGLRLAAHLARRARGKGEDPRYEELLAGSGSRDRRALRLVYLPQAALALWITLPVEIAPFEGRPLSPFDYAGLALAVVGIGFETVGDWQLSRFQARPEQAGQVLDTGLWRYTRHPNYFGDACLWWGLYFLAAGFWGGALTITSPLLMTFLLVRGTGKPILERRLGRTRPGYAEYVAKTSSFIPWPPRRSS